jgi:hypothetical protein
VNRISQGDKIESITITGDTAELFANPKVAGKVAAWNDMLDSRK